MVPDGSCSEALQIHVVQRTHAVQCFQEAQHASPLVGHPVNVSIVLQEEHDPAFPVWVVGQDRLGLRLGAQDVEQRRLAKHVDSISICSTCNECLEERDRWDAIILRHLKFAQWETQMQQTVTCLRAMIPFHQLIHQRAETLQVVRAQLLIGGDHAHQVQGKHQCEKVGLLGPLGVVVTATANKPGVEGSIGVAHQAVTAIRMVSRQVLLQAGLGSVQLLHKQLENVQSVTDTQHLLAHVVLYMVFTQFQEQLHNLQQMIRKMAVLM